MDRKPWGTIFTHLQLYPVHVLYMIYSLLGEEIKVKAILKGDHVIVAHPSLSLNQFLCSNQVKPFAGLR